jgi:hypothetical protein
MHKTQRTKRSAQNATHHQPNDVLVRTEVCQDADLAQDALGVHQICEHVPHLLDGDLPGADHHHRATTTTTAFGRLVGRRGQWCVAKRENREEKERRHTQEEEEKEEA